MGGMSAVQPLVDRGHRGSLSRGSLRRDTPGCERVAHLNNAGASLSPAVVVDRMVTHLRLEEQIGGYEAAAQVADELASGRHVIAQLVGATARQVALVESTTAGLHRVLSAVSLSRGDRVLVAGSEYASTVLPLLQLSRRMGLRVEFIPDGVDGSMDVEFLAATVDDDVRLVSVVHAPSHNGVVNDVAAIGEVLRRNAPDAWYLVDACQSLGQLPIDMGRIDCDFLIASGRKYLRGPRGSGLLAVSDRALARLDGFPVDIRGARWIGSAEFEVAASATRFESFERSVAVNLGLIEAARYAQAVSIPVLHGAITRSAEYLRSHIGAIPGWWVLDRGTQRSGIVTARHEYRSIADTVAALARAGVNGWEVTAPTNPRQLGERSVLRLSPHAYNTQAELDRALSVLADLADL